jgi:hypothetical protein
VVIFYFLRLNQVCHAPLAASGLNLCALAGNASGFLIYFRRFKGSDARTRISMSLGPPNFPLVIAMARPSKASKARKRKRLRIMPLFGLVWLSERHYFRHCFSAVSVTKRFSAFRPVFLGFHGNGSVGPVLMELNSCHVFTFRRYSGFSPTFRVSFNRIHSHNFGLVWFGLVWLIV